METAKRPGRRSDGRQPIAQDRTRRHRLIDILVIGVCCLLCGGDGFSDVDGGHGRVETRRCWCTSDISSPAGDDAKRVLAATRDHWGVENSLHWTLDVTSREDDSRIRSKNAAANVAALRRLALDMLKSETSETKLSIRRRRLVAGWNDDYPRKVLGISMRLPWACTPCG